MKLALSSLSKSHEPGFTIGAPHADQHPDFVVWASFTLSSRYCVNEICSLKWKATCTPHSMYAPVRKNGIEYVMNSCHYISSSTLCASTKTNVAPEDWNSRGFDFTPVDKSHNMYEDCHWTQFNKELTGCKKTFAWASEIRTFWQLKLTQNFWNNRFC